MSRPIHDETTPSLFILLLKEIREETFEPDPLGCGRIWTEEGGEDVFKPFRVDPANHAARI